MLPDHVTPGDFVFVEVSDTGCGMSSEDRQRMFDPFFTTKVNGRGLGLAAVLGIVRSHSGTIVVYSAPTQGTTIRVLFPALVGRETTGVVPEVTLRQGSGECILVVDDEEHVRAVTAAMLEKLGFRVLTAADGQEGLEVYQADPSAIHLVILDMAMPRMGGAAAFRAIRALNSEARVLLMSGHAEESVAAEVAGRQWSGFMQKPFSVDDLLSKIFTIIDAP